VVLGALDNREARLAVNRACYRVGRPFIDGGVDVLSGTTRVFLPPEGACYECTLGDADWAAMAQRHSCSLRRRAHEAPGDRARGRLPVRESLAPGPFPPWIVLANDWPFSVAICLPALPTRPRPNGEVREMTAPAAERGRPATDEEDPGLQGGSGIFLFSPPAVRARTIGPSAFVDVG
jgi:hypothetical protein